MSRLVLITGLQRGSYFHYDATTASGILPNSQEGPASVQGFRVKSALGRQYGYDSAAVAASTATLSGSAGYDYTGYIDFQANYPGTYGNNIAIAVNTSGTGTGTGMYGVSFTTAWSATTGYPTFTANSPAGLLAYQLV